MMQEFGLHPVDQIPSSLKDDATLEMSHFMVSLIINQELIGSGTLVRVDDAFAILTAHHVAELIESDDVTHLGVNIAAEPHGFFLPIQTLQHVVVGRCAAGVNEELGPDLSLLRLLDLQAIGTIASKKSFYNLDVPSRAEFWSDFPIDQMAWYLIGAPAERSRSQEQHGTGKHLLVAVHLIGEGTFKQRVTRGEFDFVTLRLLAGSHNFPLNYGGVSGGGVWLLPLTMDPDKGPSTISYDPPLLAGVAFYQFGVDSGECNIVCHGPESVAVRARDALRPT
jgi:hypothetical protein